MLSDVAVGGVLKVEKVSAVSGVDAKLKYAVHASPTSDLLNDIAESWGGGSTSLPETLSKLCLSSSGVFKDCVDVAPGDWSLYSSGGTVGYTASYFITITDTYTVDGVNLNSPNKIYFGASLTSFSVKPKDVVKVTVTLVAYDGSASCTDNGNDISCTISGSDDFKKTVIGKIVGLADKAITLDTVELPSPNTAVPTALSYSGATVTHSATASWNIEATLTSIKWYNGGNPTVAITVTLGNSITLDPVVQHDFSLSLTFSG